MPLLFATDLNSLKIPKGFLSTEIDGQRYIHLVLSILSVWM